MTADLKSELREARTQLAFAVQDRDEQRAFKLDCREVLDSTERARDLAIKERDESRARLAAALTAVDDLYRTDSDEGIGNTARTILRRVLSAPDRVQETPQ